MLPLGGEMIQSLGIWPGLDGSMLMLKNHGLLA